MSKVCRVGAMKAVAASAGLANLVVHAPPLPVQFGTYHSKAFMIEYESGVRVVVHTANLIYVDCNNKSQGLWYQDFPRKVGLPCC
jgi:tyrosyl-DNA phosphodiesterase-1